MTTTATTRHDLLKVGMIVHAYNMRVRLDIDQSFADRGNGRLEDYRVVPSFRGTVLNRDEFAPGGKHEDAFIFNHTFDGWTVQGRGDLPVTVEVGA